MQGILTIVEMVAITATAKRGKMRDMIIQTEESRAMIRAWFWRGKWEGHV